MQLISLFFEALLSFSSIVIVFTGFGYWILSFTQLSKKLNTLEYLIIANVISFSLLGTTLFVIGSFFGILIYKCLYAVLLIGVYSFISNRNVIKQGLQTAFEQRKSAIFALLSSVLMAATLLGSWILKSDVLYIQNGQVHDSVWHIALIKNLQHAIPPLHPSSFSETLTHYHYFYDLIIAAISSAFHTSDIILYFQVFPLYLTLLLSLTIIIFARTFKNNLYTFLLTLFTFYGGGFTYLLPLFLTGHNSQESSFWVSQTFSMMLNPQLIYSFSLMYSVLFLMRKIYQEKKPNSILHLIIIFLTVTSIGFKSYSFIVLLLMYIPFITTLFINTKNKLYIIFGFLTVILSMPLYFMVVGNDGSGTFFYKPLWFIDTMIVADDRLNFVKAKLVEDFYRENNEMLKVYFIKSVEIVAFYIGNLGTRSIFFLLPILLVTKFSSFKNQQIIFVLFFAFIITSIFPLLFLQKGTVWNSIQFWYYSLIIANILATYACIRITEYIQKQSKNTLSIYAFICAISIFSVIPYFQTIKNKITIFETVKDDTIVVLQQLKPDDRVLVCPNAAVLYNNSFVTAYSGAKTYFTDVGQLALTGMQDVEAKEVQLQDMLYKDDQDELQEFIKNQKISVIICNKDNQKLKNLKNVNVFFIE